MKGYIAKDDDGSVWIHSTCPRRIKHLRDETYEFFWVSSIGGSFMINPDLFPDIKSEDNPRVVNIDITLTDEFVPDEEIPDMYEKTISNDENGKEDSESSIQA